MKSKKAVIDQMIGLGIGISILAVIIVVGIVVLGNFADSQATCGSIGGDANTEFNQSDGFCYNSSGSKGTSKGGIIAESAYYAEGKLSSNSGGFLTWLPVVIPAVIGIAVIGYFMMLRGRGKDY